MSRDLFAAKAVVYSLDVSLCATVAVLDVSCGNTWTFEKVSVSLHDLYNFTFRPRGWRTPILRAGQLVQFVFGSQVLTYTELKTKTTSIVIATA